MKYNERGEEILDNVELEVPVKFKRPPSIQELIAMHVKAAVQVERKMGKREEADDDFEEDEETDDVLTPYEIDAYAAEASSELQKAEETQKVLASLQRMKNGPAEVKSGAATDVSVGKADSGVKGPGSEVAGGSAEKDSGVTKG